MPSQIMPTVNLLKLPDPAAQTAKYVNMMNATKQQEAAERQAKIAQDTLNLKIKEDVRDEAKQGPTLTKLQQDNAIQALIMFRDAVGDIDENDIAAKEAVRADLVSKVPGYDKFLPPASQWTGDRIKRLMMDSAKEIDKLYATPIASVAVNDITGQTTSITAGGLDPRAEVIGNVAPTPAVAPRTPTAPPQAAQQQQQTTPGPVPNGKYGEARVRPDNATPLTPDMQADIDRIKKSSGMVNTPASFTLGSMGTPTAGQMSPDMVPAILDSAVKTGVMAQIDLDQMLAMTPPQARDGIMQVIRDSKIALQADAPSLAASAMNQQQPMAPNPVQRPEARFADMRGPAPRASFADLGGQPQMQNTMAQSQGRTPFVARRESPAPGIYGVPTDQVAATSRATRPSKQEMYDAEAARIKAERDAGPPPITQLQKLARKTELAKAFSKTQTLLDKAYNPQEGIITLANKIKMLSDDQKEAITGFSGYVPSFRGSTREADTLLGNLKGVVTALGKDVAAASGAISSMAVQEWTIVADMIAKLDPTNMTPRALDAQMDRIIKQVDLSTRLAEQVYDAQYGNDVKEYPAFKLKGSPPARTKTPVVKGGSMISPDIQKILKSRGI
jgi:hypothetical protein